MIRILFAALWLLLLGGCTVQQKAGIRQGTRLHFLSQYVIPYQYQYKGTTVGGLSGLDYDRSSGLYYFICDDRSAINPSRFYTGRIHINRERIDSVSFTAIQYLKRADGSLYPSFGSNPYEAADPESIRYDAKRKELVWSSEGERMFNKEVQVQQNGAIYRTDLSAAVKDSFQLPEQLQVRASEKGPRKNGVFEGLSFAHNYRSLYVSVEEPIYNDGPRAGTGDSAAWIRIARFDASGKKSKAQYAYRIEPVARVPMPAGAFKVNGVPELLWLRGDQFLVVERSFSTGWTGCSVRLYLADFSKATNIAGLGSLQGASFVPARKELLLDLDSLGFPVYNIEGVALGPKLYNGRQSLLLISDDNFNAEEKTQVLLFEIR